MEPRYHDGDVLLIQNCDSVEVGEMGIFILDGSGYFKIFGGDRLISINSQYSDILLKDFEEILCTGRVVGKLKKKWINRAANVKFSRPISFLIGIVKHLKIW